MVNQAESVKCAPGDLCSDEQAVVISLVSRDSSRRRLRAASSLPSRRIARDLHDVVAHHVAVIDVQVGVVAHPLREQPDAAEEAVAHVRQAARTVLAELSIVRGVLRSEEQDAEHASTTKPPPGLGVPGRYPARVPAAVGVEGLGGFR
ncbi:histidine kinase dimerization/phosphoacceptor domain-containing protein [Streptomyces sp. NPDC001642]|uniref:histidine kinase dimerization/phosphoacceptor domain-containing protein n=1 Tax=Streptomyces sp. NPDC001642 TaxID=3154392 RepID=UPI003327B744